MNDRMAKIGGVWTAVELVSGNCDYATVIHNGTQINVDSGLIETFSGYESRMRRMAAKQVSRPIITDKTLVIDPDMASTY